MAPSNSASKVAKLASRGKGKKVRFQGGTVFPAVVAAVVIVLLGLVVYARASRPSDGSGPPRLGDHWHAAYGLRVCDAWLPNLIGTKEETGIDSSGQSRILDRHFREYGIHSHGDGVIHYHPYTSRATGTRARLGVFLDAYDIKLNDTVLELPADQVGAGEQSKWDTKDFKCNGEDTQIRVRVWEDFSKPGQFVDYVTDFKNIRIDRNGMAFAIAVEPKAADIPQPPSAPKLPELGAVDGGTNITVPAAAGDVTGTVAPGDSTPAGGSSGDSTRAATTPSSTASTATGDTVASTSGPATTVSVATTSGG